MSLQQKRDMFPKRSMNERRILIKIKSEKLASSLLTTSDVINYFYIQNRLFHPNEVQRIEILNKKELVIMLLFETDKLALIFFMKCSHPNNIQLKDTEFEMIDYSPKFNAKYIYQNASILNCCVLQRPIHLKLDPLKQRQTARCISRWNGIVTMQFSHNKCVSFFVYNQPYSHPKNIKFPLHRLPPPIIERFDLFPQHIENYYISENDNCIVIDFGLSQLPTFYQYGFIATEIKSDKERLNKKYDKNNNDKEEEKDDDDEDILNDIHKQQSICPYIRWTNVCDKYRKNCCPYKYHPKMEKNVDFGNNDTIWNNPNNAKIIGLPSARRQPKDINEEFLSYIISDQQHNECLYLQDIIHNCFILRITIIKYQNNIKKEWYQKRLNERFNGLLILPPKHDLNPTKQIIPYPMVRCIKHNNNNNEELVDYFVSPVSYITDLENASYIASMKQFINKLNSNNGSNHLEAFCLMGCLINYPPIFIIEDFHISDYLLLEKDIKYGDHGKVWQVLKKLMEGNIDKNKWKSSESHRARKGDLDRNISKHTASCRERYCIRNGRNVSFLDIYIDIYFNIDLLDQLKQQQMGESINRFEWIKSLKITPIYYHLMVDQEKSCRMFRLKEHLHESAITFLRIEFQSVKRCQRFNDEWEYGTYSRQQVYNILSYGISCGGAKYEFFFFSDNQLRDKVCWMYSCQLSANFNSIKAVRNNLGNFEDIQNAGKKMSRMGLYNTESTQITTINAAQMEFINDPIALDEKKLPLTDGCSIIKKQIVNENIGRNIVSMLARLGGAKCMLIALTPYWIRKVIETDQTNKRNEILEKIEKEKQNKNKTNNNKKLEILYNQLKQNENRNFNADVVITRTSKKFEFDKYNLEIAVKEYTESKAAFTNKEFIGAAYYHYYTKNQHKLFEQTLQRYAVEWFKMLNNARKTEENNHRIDRKNALIFLNVERHKGKYKKLLEDMKIAQRILNKRNSGFGRRRGQQPSYQDAKYLSNIKNEEERCNKFVKDCWIDIINKLRIYLPWPSCRIHGVADWTGTLDENEIFLKIEVPLTVKISCKQCGIGRLDRFDEKCGNEKCNALRPKYLVYVGNCGLLKNPCLHPRSYKLFNAVYDKLLDELFDGECLLFSTKTTCTTSPVFAMSGADLDGDHFLVVTQNHLLPSSSINIAIQNFDEQGEEKSSQYIDDYTIIDYFLEYALHANTAELSQLHEAYSEHNIEGIGHKHCIIIAKYHSFALDFPKTGKAAIFPKDIGIPMNKEINKYGHCIYPHYMTNKPIKQKFHSKMIKGRFYDFVCCQIPKEFINQFKFKKEANLIYHHGAQLPSKPFLRNNDESEKYQYHQNNNNIYNDDGYHWLDAAMIDHNDIDNNDNDDNFDDDMKWIEELSYSELCITIKSEQVKKYLKDAQKLTISEINELRDKLSNVQRESRFESIEQYEAFHLEYYYSTILQNIKKQQIKQQTDTDSDNINENEEEKRSID